MKKTLTFLLSPFNNSSIWSSRGKYQLSGALVIQIPYSDGCSVWKGSAGIPCAPFLHGSELKLQSRDSHEICKQEWSAATALWMKIIKIRGADRRCERPPAYPHHLSCASGNSVPVTKAQGSGPTTISLPAYPQRQLLHRSTAAHSPP